MRRIHMKDKTEERSDGVLLDDDELEEVTGGSTFKDNTIDKGNEINVIHTD